MKIITQRGLNARRLFSIGLSGLAVLVTLTPVQKTGASVASIVKPIDEIAFQTNILALNAAVEAARTVPPDAADLFRDIPATRHV